MTAEEFRQLTMARPFVPFRVHMTDGSSHWVPHPEFAWAYGRRAWVAAGPEGKGSLLREGPKVNILYLLHVARVETEGPLPTAGS